MDKALTAHKGVIMDSIDGLLEELDPVKRRRDELIHLSILIVGKIKKPSVDKSVDKEKGEEPCRDHNG